MKKVNREHPSPEYLLMYWKLHEPLVGSLLDCIDKIGGHFHESGHIKGDGNWRLTEIFNAVQEARASENTCLEGMAEAKKETT